MEQQLLTSKKYFKNLSIIFYALVVEQILLIAIALVSCHFLAFPAVSYKMQGILTIGMSFIAVLGFFAGKGLFRNEQKKILSEENLTKKMQRYKSALIKKYAILEFVSLCAVICAVVTDENIFLTFSLIIVLLFFIEKPSEIRASKDLDLSPEDIQKLKNPNEIIG